MKVLVTGASGRIGRALVQRLAPTHQVLGLDRRRSATAGFIGDLADGALLERALQGVDAVVHAAALHAPQVGQLPDAEFMRVNVQGTRALLRAAQRHAVQHIVYTSTTALYGQAATPAGRAAWVTESLLPQPRTIYHRSKLAAEALLAEAAQRGGPALTVLRMSRCFPEAAPLMACYRLHRGVDARDVAQAHWLALGEAAPVARQRCFVISGATPFSEADVSELWRDAPAALRRHAPALVEAFARRAWPLPSSIDRVYSPALAQAVLGWQPRHGFESVLAQLDAGSAEVLAAPLAGRG